MDILIWFAVPFFLFSVLLEPRVLSAVSAKTGKAFVGYELKDSLASLSMGLGNVTVYALWQVVPIGAYFLCYEQVGVFREFLQPSMWWAWLILFFGDELCYYVFHRVAHRTRFAWAAHSNHHSSQHYNLSTALRQSWTSPFFKFIFYLPLALLGFHPLMMLTMQSLSLIYQFWIHTEAIGKMPRWFESFFNTPSHHRVHHGSNAAYIDKNYGGFLILFDRLFGTFAAESEPARYGMVKNLQTYNPFKVAFAEWHALVRDMGRAGGVKSALACLVREPAWRPPLANEMTISKTPPEQGRRFGG